MSGRHRASAADHRRAARSGVEWGGAGIHGRRLQQPRTALQYLGPVLPPAAKFVDSAALETFDPAKHDVLVWLGCAGAFEADYQKSLRSLFEILRVKQVTFGVLSKEKCTGDPAKRTGNEYMYQELANANIEDLKAAGRQKDSHVVSALREDDRRRLSEVRLYGADRALGGVHRRNHARHGVGAARPASGTLEDGDLPRSLLPGALRQDGGRAARPARRASARM